MANEKIVVFDWDPMKTRVLAALLQHEGYAVFPANTIAEAETQLAQQKPALIILEVAGPNGEWTGEGFGLLERIKQGPNPTPVLVLTARPDDATIYQCWRAGSDACLTRPPNMMELRTFVMRILQPRHGDDFKL